MKYRDQWIDRARLYAARAAERQESSPHHLIWRHWQIGLIKAAARKMRERGERSE